MEEAFANVPALPGVTCIAPDVSASMTWGTFSRRGLARFVDIAALFAAAALRRAEHPILLPFDHQVVEVELSLRDPLATTAGRLLSIGGGGTALAAPITFLSGRSVRVDTFIGITDNEEWACGSGGHGREAGFLDAWRRYRRAVNPDARAFLLTIAPYHHAVAPSSEPGVTYLYGWSDAVLGFIADALAGPDAQMAAVRATELERDGAP